jgi:DNA processing protein
MEAIATPSENGPIYDHKRSYEAPCEVEQRELKELVAFSGRDRSSDKQMTFLGSRNGSGVPIYCAGNLALLKKRTVAIVGSRDVSDEGLRRAARLGRELADDNVVVSSGLAKGVDTAALTQAIKANGSVMAVIGTPLDTAYPAQNKRLQEEIYRDHLLLTPFEEGTRVYPSNFPQRNRVMAMLSDATVIIEATDKSGTLHQAAECVRQQRHLFIAKSVVDNPNISWPSRFLDESSVHVLESTSQLLDIVYGPACLLP